MVQPVLSADKNLPARILFEGAQEILGTDPLLKTSPCSSQVELPRMGEFLQSLEDCYGALAGQGLALRIGRAAFRYGLKQFGDRAGFRTAEFRLLPAPRRLENGLSTLAQIFSKEAGSSISITDEGTFWSWQVRDCPFCEDHQAAGPACSLMIGLLQEFMTWAGGGRFYRVVETACQASGSPACIYRIDKKPLD